MQEFAVSLKKKFYVYKFLVKIQGCTFKVFKKIRE